MKRKRIRKPWQIKRSMGDAQTIAQWAREAGITVATLRRQIKQRRDADATEAAARNLPAPPAAWEPPKPDK